MLKVLPDSWTKIVSTKEVLWVSVGQRAVELWAVKVGSQKRILPIGPARAKRVRTRLIGRFFFLPSTLTFYC